MKSENESNYMKNIKNETIENMLRGHMITQLVSSAARFDRNGIIKSGINSPINIAHKTGIHENAILRYMAQTILSVS